MVTAVSSSAHEIKAAWAEFNRAAGAVVAAGVSGEGDLAGAIVDLDQRKFQVMASLLVMRKSNETLASLLDTFDY